MVARHRFRQKPSKESLFYQPIGRRQHPKISVEQPCVVSGRAAETIPDSRDRLNSSCAPSTSGAAIATPNRIATRQRRSFVLRALYDWTMAKAASPHADRWMAAVSFAESSFFPLPPDLLLVPMVLANRAAWWRIALLCTVSSVIGGLAGYAIGYFLYETIGMKVIEFYHLADKFEALRATFIEYGAEILIIKGMTPIPYKLLTITAGVAGLNIWVFIGASIISRSMRFFLVAALLYWCGEPVRAFIEKRLTLVTTLVAAAVIGGFFVVKLL
jgi:membrane protein YqaA with SNARE-associated domain